MRDERVGVVGGGVDDMRQARWRDERILIYKRFLYYSATAELQMMNVIGSVRKARAQARALGFQSLRAEPLALQSPGEGSVWLGLFRLGLGGLRALSPSLHITSREPRGCSTVTVTRLLIE